MEREDYQVEKSMEGYRLNRATVEDLKLEFVKGLSPAIRDHVRDKVPFTVWPQMSFDQYNALVIEDKIRKGYISDGSDSPFDDRKLRFDKAVITIEHGHTKEGQDYPGGLVGKRMITAFGITDYQEFRADQDARDELNLENQAAGEREFSDKYAFFSRCPGIAVLPISKDGSTFVGERTNVEAGGFLNAVAGHLKFRNPEEVDLMEDLYRELEEEFGIKKDYLIAKPIFVGVYSNPIKGDLDFTYIVQTAVPDDYFTSGRWKDFVSEKEHKPLIQLASMGDIQRLLNEGRVPDGREFPLMYSTRGALESVTEEELRAL